METQHSKNVTSHDFGELVTWQNASVYDCLDKVNIYVLIRLKAPTDRPVVLEASVCDALGAVLHTREKSFESFPASTNISAPILLDNLMAVDVLGGRTTPPGEYFAKLQVTINGNKYYHYHKILVRNIP